MDILIDSNVILDILTQDQTWYDWASITLARHINTDTIVINPVIYAEVSIRFSSMADCDRVLSPTIFRREPIPWEAAFIAGKCFLQYRKNGGQRRSPLPDFFIGVHAQVKKMSLMPRDVARCQTYFPDVQLINP